MPRAAHKSGAALRYERQMREARDALAAQAAQVAEVQQAAPAPVPPPGTYRIADLREGQCRFACTPHTARAEEHQFCGEPVAWLRGKPTSCGLPPEKWSSLRYGFEPCGGCHHGTEEAYG